MPPLFLLLASTLDEGYYVVGLYATREEAERVRVDEYREEWDEMEAKLKAARAWPCPPGVARGFGEDRNVARRERLYPILEMTVGRTIPEAARLR